MHHLGYHYVHITYVWQIVFELAGSLTSVFENHTVFIAVLWSVASFMLSFVNKDILGEQNQSSGNKSVSCIVRWWLLSDGLGK